MENIDIIFKIIEVLLQLILVIFAGFALFTWKKEMYGKDKYIMAKKLLEYIKDIRFFIHSPTSMHFIYLNDILSDRAGFYKKNISSVGEKQIYFDVSIFALFKDWNFRSDFFIPKRVRKALYAVSFFSAKLVSKNKYKHTYIQLMDVDISSIFLTTDDLEKMEKQIICLSGMEKLTIKEYFKRWEKLIAELQKIV